MNHLNKYFWFFILLLVCMSCTSVKCLNTNRGQYVLDQETVQGKACTTFTCVREVDMALQKNLEKKGKRLLQIYLIRHAKPNLKKKLFYSMDEAHQYMIDYNLVPIQQVDSSLVQVDLNKKHTILCSNLRRSKETAHAIFGDQFPMQSDSLFREFEIKAVRANSIVKLPLLVWQFFSRGSWYLGFNHRGIESHREARERARKCAIELVQRAQQQETAILVGHGMLNGAIERTLEKEGWQTIQDNGHINLGATILVKVVEK